MKITDDTDHDSRLGQETPKAPLSAGGDSKIPKRRLIKIDSSFMTEDTDEEEEGEEEEMEEEQAGEGNPWQRTGSLVLSSAEIQHYCDTTLECRPNSSSSNLSIKSPTQQCSIL